MKPRLVQIAAKSRPASSCGRDARKINGRRSSFHTAGGETVLITDRDRVVAELVPPQPGRNPLLADARLAEAVREGWFAPPLLAASGVMTLRDLMLDLKQDREDR